MSEFTQIIFENNFQISKELGSGHFGTVFQVREISSDKIFAVKKINETNENHRNDLLREVQTMRKCDPKYVVQYYNSWIEGNHFYIQMECCHHNLQYVIERKEELFERRNKKMTENEFFFSAEVFKELLECVQYLHESKPPIMHRDLKPQNILFIGNSRFSGRNIKLGDFGSATFDSLNTASHTRYVGTLKYMAPEVNLGTKYNIKSDVYSLSIIMIELFDFNVYEQDEIEAGYLTPKWKYLKKIIVRMMDRDYKERPTCEFIMKNYTRWAINSNELHIFRLELLEITPNDQDELLKKYFNNKIKTKLKLF